jgi:hypothetical protein
MKKITLTQNCIHAIESIISRGDDAEVKVVDGKPKVLSSRKKVEYFDSKSKKSLESFDNK